MSFCYPKVEYLGHFITQEGVFTNLAKIRVVSEWPTRKTLKQLRWFLGLAGYYRCFVKYFGKIAKPLTDLLKIYYFEWTQVAAAALQSLKNCFGNSSCAYTTKFL